MADDGSHQPVATQCGSGTNADFAAFANDVHGNLASEICETCGGEIANSMGSHFVDCQQQKCQRHVWRIDEFSASVLY